MAKSALAPLPTRLRMADLVSALSAALDLSGGQPMGWALRTCLIGMRLADVIGLPSAQYPDLYYALLLKDSGCSSNAARVAKIFNCDDLLAKRETELLDWQGVTWAGFRTGLKLANAGQPWPSRLARLTKLGFHRRRDAVELVQLRCERGADIALKMGFSQATAEAIRALDEHWDGGGAPRGLRGRDIPLLAQIVNLAQTMALFALSGGAGAALAMVRCRAGRWFDPSLVRAAERLEPDRNLWRRESESEARRRVLDLDPGDMMFADDGNLDSVCEAFADVIDAKTPYTSHHSRRVATTAEAIAIELQLSPAAIALVRRAALLHDLGKLGTSNTILEKPGKLNDVEWAALQWHPQYTYDILVKIDGWRHLAFVAAAHHERLDGSGYPHRLTAADLPSEARVIAVADVYDALSSPRPYRPALPMDEVFGTLAAQTPHALDAHCVAALRGISAGD